MEVKEIAEQIKASFEQFKSENDRRLKEIEKNGRADPLTEEKINKHSDAIGALQKQLDDVQKKAQRIGSGSVSEADEAKATHRKAYGEFLRKGKHEGAALRELEMKALQTTVEVDGGYAIPEELERNIGTMERQLSPLEAEVSSITVGAETYEKLLADGMAASGWVGEAAARPDTASPTLASFKPLYGEAYAKPKATQKMLDDAFFDVEAWLAEEISQKFAQDIDAAIASGDGVNKPKGVLAYPLEATGDATRAYGTIEKKHSGVAGDFTSDNLIDLVHLLRPGYRQGAKFAMAGTTVAKIRKMKDSSGNYLWAPGLVGQPSQVLGFQIVEDENIPIVAAASNSVLFGNLKRAFKLVNLRGVRILRDPFTDKPYVVFYATKRVGGGVEDTRAVKVLHLAA